MERTIRELIEFQVDQYGTDHTLRRYSVMRKDLKGAVILLKDKHVSMASVLTDIDHVLECVMESLKYNRH